VGGRLVRVVCTSTYHYHNDSCVFDSSHEDVCSVHLYVIKFVRALLKVGE
jgi:hypothetical protein